MTSLVQRLDELLGRRVAMRSLAVLRILAGPIVLLHLQPFLEQAAGGVIYRDVFHQPYASWYPDLSRSLYVTVLVAGAVGAVAMTIGLFTRAATLTVLAAVSYNLFLSTTHYHHNRGYLVIVLAALAVVPCGRELSVDAWLRRRRRLPALDQTAPGWPLWLLRFEAATVYGASGLSKLLDADWFAGTVTWDRMVSVQDLMAARSVPGWVIDVVADRGFHTYAAKVIVISELFIAIGLWWRATRYAAVWVAVCFHVAIELTASVQVFSYLAVAALLIWAVPSTRDRTLAVDLATPAGRRIASTVHRLDWLARFAVVDSPAGNAREGPAGVTDRDGTVYHGIPALIFIGSRLPLTAWLTLPLLLLPAVRRARRAPPLVPAAA